MRTPVSVAHIHSSFSCIPSIASIAADIVEGRLEVAKQLGADVVINCKTQNLRDEGEIGLVK